ncbi:MAG: hypothetical protein L6Q71_00590, partial [Planctomycetes bacterium]|nr:hypothetical protein [Planctomycetota bacterium]
VDTREITERVRSELRPEVTRTVQDVARTYAPGPWGEIAAAGVGLLATILGVVSVRSRKRVVAA